MSVNPIHENKILMKIYKFTVPDPIKWNAMHKFTYRKKIKLILNLALKICLCFCLRTNFFKHFRGFPSDFPIQPYCFPQYPFMKKVLSK